MSLVPVFRSAWRRLRHGRPIVIVSGLPRSGTSMMMQMLQAGGLAAVTDGVRAADADNPKGYFELARVLTLDKDGDTAWLRAARGKCVKVISALLPHLPEIHRYRVIFMQRDLQEVVCSQNAMLAARGQPAGTSEDDDRMRGLFEAHLLQIGNLLDRRGGFEVLRVAYADVVREPLVQSERICEFLGRELDTTRMAAAVDRSLHRTRGA